MWIRPHSLLLIGLAACELPTAVPRGARPFEPPAVYRQWWALTERCSGLRGDFDAVQWYEIPETSFGTTSEGERVDALWTGAGNRIVLTAAPDGRREGDLVRHEMLHALMRAGGHSRDLFVARCGGVVTCMRSCVRGSTPVPADPAAIPVTPSQLELSVDVQVVPPAWPDSQRYAMMVITARNLSRDPWLMQLPAPGDVGPPVSFSYKLIDARGTTFWLDIRADAPEVTRFALGETKRYIFDFFVRPGASTQFRYDIAPGTWTFHGAFGEVWAPIAPTLDLSR
ncbi:MAG: hypothetical protein ACYC3Q_10030 [Gemmatimonadaceae bacterium]